MVRLSKLKTGLTERRMWKGEQQNSLFTRFLSESSVHKHWDYSKFDQFSIKNQGEILKDSAEHSFLYVFHTTIESERVGKSFIAVASSPYPQGSAIVSVPRAWARVVLYFILHLLQKWASYCATEECNKGKGFGMNLNSKVASNLKSSLFLIKFMSFGGMGRNIVLSMRRRKDGKNVPQTGINVTHCSVSCA